MLLIPDHLVENSIKYSEEVINIGSKEVEKDED
jgi:hypothetical protein